MPAKKAVKKVNTRPAKVDSSLIEVPTSAPGDKRKWSDGNVTRKEIEERGAYPATVVKVEEAAKMISKGKGRAEIIEHLQKKYDMSYENARKYFVSACHFLIPDDQGEFRQGLIKQNMERLEKIVTDSMNDKQYKIAREAIAELNKMMGVTGGQSVTINQDPESGQQQIIVNFG